jgi:hypothetical protein
MQGFTSIPFKTESAHGLTSVNGVAKFSSAGIVLEFEAKLFGLISHGVKEARLAVAEILDVKFKKGVMRRGAKVEVRLNSFVKLADIPHNEGKIVLKITVDDFERARDAVERLQKNMSEYAASLPPPQTPVRSLFSDSEDETEELKT